MYPHLSEEEIDNLKNAFYYCPTSPTFLRHSKHKGKGKKIHDVAGSSKTVSYFKKNYLVRRIIMLLHDHDINGMNVVPIDNNPLNNRYENLRLTPILRMPDRPAGNCSSGHNGVSKVGNYWVAKSYPLKCKYFSIKKYGDDVAKNMAINARHEMIKEKL
jgi:hypothetical protein